MIDRLFPKCLDGGYRGQAIALWIFGVIALMKIALGAVHIFRPDGGAQSVSHIPLDSYPAGAAQNVIAVFARMGLEQLLLGMAMIFVLTRFRALIPLMFAIAAIGQAGGFALASFKPLSLAAPSGALPLHLVLSGLTLVGLALSLTGKRYSNPGTETR